MFKRKAYDRLQEWKERSQGRTANRFIGKID